MNRQLTKDPNNCTKVYKPNLPVLRSLHASPPLSLYHFGMAALRLAISSGLIQFLARKIA